MAGKKTELGPSGAAVASNVRRLRESRGLSYAELSRRLADLGRDIPPLGLRRIESEARRVDADDLMALAVALRVSPLILLLPDMPDRRQEVDVTGFSDPARVEYVWAWLRADQRGPGVSSDYEFISGAWPSWLQDRERIFVDELQEKEAERAHGDD